MDFPAFIQLGRARGRLIDKAEALVNAAEAEGRDLTAEESEQYENLLSDAQALGARQDRLEQIGAAKAEGARVAAFNGPLAKPGRFISLNQEPSVEGSGDGRKSADGGLTFGAVVLSLARARGVKGDALDFASKRYGSSSPVCNALAAGDASSGGFMVPESVSAEAIELLRPQSVVRALGATTVPLIGSVTIPKFTAGSSFSYIGESEDIEASEQSLGAIRLTSKKLAGLVPISNDLIRHAKTGAEQMIIADIVAGLAVAEDQAMLRGLGTGATPKGLLYLIAEGHKFDASSTVNFANTMSELNQMLTTLQLANVRMIRPGWIMNPRTRNFLSMLTHTNGSWVFREEMLGGTLMGFPFRVTTSVPTNLGAGGDESEIYLIDFADVIIGDVPSLTIDLSGEATYKEGNGLVSAFSKDQTVVRIIAEHDLAMRHSESGTVLEAVTWTG